MMTAPVFSVPERFNRNSPKVMALMAPEQSGRWLLQRMQQHLGITDYATQSMLDFGCGVRFTQAILNLGLPIAQYVGVDCFPEMINFLSDAVKDPRFSFHLLDAMHPLYNPAGSAQMGPSTRLPIPERHFDIACMFSVITHLHPDDARHTLTLLHRHVQPQGQLFFTCFLDDSIREYEDRSPSRNGGICFYHPAFLQDLLFQTGWQTTSRHPGDGPLIGDSFVCRPWPCHETDQHQHSNALGFEVWS